MFLWDLSMALEILLDIENTASPLGNIAPDKANEADHRIANMLALIGGSVRLQAANAAKQDRFKGDEVRLLLAGIAARINAAAQLHRWLSAGASETDIDFAGYSHRL